MLLVCDWYVSLKTIGLEKEAGKQIIHSTPCSSINGHELRILIRTIHLCFAEFWRWFTYYFEQNFVKFSVLVLSSTRGSGRPPRPRTRPRKRPQTEDKAKGQGLRARRRGQGHTFCPRGTHPWYTHTHIHAHKQTTITIKNLILVKIKGWKTCLQVHVDESHGRFGYQIWYVQCYCGLCIKVSSKFPASLVSATPCHTYHHTCTTPAKNFNFYFGGLLFTSHWLNLQHWRGFYIAVCGNFQGLFFDFRGLLFAFRGRNRPEPPCNFFADVHTSNTIVILKSRHTRLYHFQLRLFTTYVESTTDNH